MVVRPVKDRKLLQKYLEEDRVGCVYQLGYLDEAFQPWCRWWGVFNDAEELKLVLLLYTGLSVPIAMTVGDARYIDNLLNDAFHELPDRFFCHLRASHKKAFNKFYDTTELTAAKRMSLKKSAYQTVDPNPSVTRLGHRDTAQIMKLYDHYPDNLFEPYQLETGSYFGVYRRPGGDLISIAGIHVLSEDNDVAVIGNLVTHPRYRGQNLATTVCGRLLNELYESVSLVALNVPSDNLSMLRLVKHFGFNFKRNHSYWEGLIKRSEFR